MRIPEVKPHAREWACFLVGASHSVVAASMLHPTCLWALSCQAHMSVVLDGNNCCVASFFTKPNGLHIPSPFFPLPTIRPFAFLPTSPHPFAAIALSSSFCHRSSRPKPPLPSSRRRAAYGAYEIPPRASRRDACRGACPRRGIIQLSHGGSPSPPWGLRTHAR